MLLEGIFGGGSQADAPSQSSPSSGSGETNHGNNTATTPANGGQADSVENYSPEETDDGTYSPTPPTQADTDEPVDNTAEKDIGAAPEDSGSQPADETDTAEPVPTAETDASGDEMVAEQPASSEPTLPVEDDNEIGTEPVEEEPTAPADTSASAEKNGAATGVRDFLTPLLADLQAIRERASAKATDEISASQRRAAANVHDQMIRQMLDQISTGAATSAKSEMFDSMDAQQTQSLPARWYAEA